MQFPGTRWSALMALWAVTPTLGLSGLPERDPLVRVDRFARGVVIDLRYASGRNVLGRPLYPPGQPALLRRSVARQLDDAADRVAKYGFRLVLLDGWRPIEAQQALLKAPGAGGFVEAEPHRALHARGIAVDVTLADPKGREVRMPTAFDHFGPESRLRYQGGDPVVRRNLGVLQKAMGQAGFIGCRTEWWHFVSQPGAGVRTLGGGARP